MLPRIAVALAACAAIASAQQPIDAAYTAKLKELTPTDPNWKFTTELVDHLPASKTVPTPLAVLGYVPGTIGKLGSTAEIYKYFRTVAEKSPRVKVYSMGQTELGREMIVAAIADEATIKRLDDYKAMTRRMADPRGISAAERQKLLREAKPIYYISASIHSPETGSPDMTMELLYRLAVDESDYFKAIRKNIIVMINPVFEADGRDHQVDWYNQQKALKITAQQAGGLPYWGKYVAHDNNRDGMVVSLALTKNWLKTFLDWRPTITHDLHESVPFLYTSTGTGPYNEEFDPLTVDEWHTLAYQEITELTRRGLPGVWTHSFYDGWAANYQNAIGNLHNAAGRFYETYTSSGADCINKVNLPATATSRTWDRSSPPVNGVKWCIRSNQNYQQSALLIALKYVADHRETFVANNITKNENTVRRGQRGPLYAFVIPKGQRHAGEAADLVNLFRLQGAEVQEASADFSYKDGGADVAVKKGDWVVRLDQPNALFVRTVLAVQKFKPEDPNPYDDTGWTLDELRHVTTLKVQDSTIFAKPMTPLSADAKVDGSVSGTGATLIVKHMGDWRSATLPFKVGAAMKVADSAFVVDGATYPAGTWLVADAPAARAAITAAGLKAVATASVTVKQHDVKLPRIALAHSWSSTQEEGWVRITFDKLGIPYTYVSDQKFKQPGVLEKFDVVIYPNAGAVGTLVNGRPKIGPAVPWKKSATTPNLGEVDETDDVRDGIGIDGVAALQKFVAGGGLLISEGGAVNLPVSLQITSGVSVVEPRALQARGGVFRAQTVTGESPILYGYADKQFPLFFSNAPLLQVGGGGPGGGGGGGGAGADTDPAYAAAVRALQPKVIVRYHSVVDSLLISGQMNGGAELAGKAAVVDAPVGKGHVVLFATRPFWRYQTQGAWAMAFNAVVHWNALTTAAAPPAGERGARRP